MKITIIRHEKVQMTWEKKYNSAGFDLACDTYDRCDIIAKEKENFQMEDVQAIYISELVRTYQTACKLYGKRDFIKTPLFNEVPLKSFKDTKHVYPLWVWNVLGRLQWLCESRRQEETKKETIERARQAIRLLEENGEDCCVVTHGFFMRTLIGELKRKGYRIEKSNTFGISNLDRIFAERK